jgi:hypothetical protein
MLAQILKSLAKAFSNPQVQGALMRQVVKNDFSPSKMGQQLKREWNDIWGISESVHRVRMKLTDGRRQIEAIVEARNYHANNIANSQIVQGDNNKVVINNYNIYIKFIDADIRSMEQIAPILKTFESGLPEPPPNPSEVPESVLMHMSEQAERVNRESSPLLQQADELVARATDPEKLRQALGISPAGQS